MEGKLHSQDKELEVLNVKKPFKLHIIHCPTAPCKFEVEGHSYTLKTACEIVYGYEGRAAKQGLRDVVEGFMQLVHKSRNDYHECVRIIDECIGLLRTYDTDDNEGTDEDRKENCNSCKNNNMDESALYKPVNNKVGSNLSKRATTHMIMEKAYFVNYVCGDAKQSINILDEEYSRDTSNIDLLKYLIVILKRQFPIDKQRLQLLYLQALSQESQLTVYNKWLVWRDYLFFLDKKGFDSSVVVQAKKEFNCFLNTHPDIAEAATGQRSTAKEKECNKREENGNKRAKLDDNILQDNPFDRGCMLIPMQSAFRSISQSFTAGLGTATASTNLSNENSRPCSRVVVRMPNNKSDGIHATATTDHERCDVTNGSKISNVKEGVKVGGSHTKKNAIKTNDASADKVNATRSCKATAHNNKKGKGTGAEKGRSSDKAYPLIKNDCSNRAIKAVEKPRRYKRKSTELETKSNDNNKPKVDYKAIYIKIFTNNMKSGTNPSVINYNNLSDLTAVFRVNHILYENYCKYSCSNLAYLNNQLTANSGINNNDKSLGLSPVVSTPNRFSIRAPYRLPPSPCKYCNKRMIKIYTRNAKIWILRSADRYGLKRSISFTSLRLYRKIIHLERWLAVFWDAYVKTLRHIVNRRSNHNDSRSQREREENDSDNDSVSSDDGGEQSETLEHCTVYCACQAHDSMNRNTCRDDDIHIYMNKIYEAYYMASSFVAFVISARLRNSSIGLYMSDLHHAYSQEILSNPQIHNKKIALSNSNMGEFEGFEDSIFGRLCSDNQLEHMLLLSCGGKSESGVEAIDFCGTSVNEVIDWICMGLGYDIMKDNNNQPLWQTNAADIRNRGDRNRHRPHNRNRYKTKRNNFVLNNGDLSCHSGDSPIYCILQFVYCSELMENYNPSDNCLGVSASSSYNGLPKVEELSDTSICLGIILYVINIYKLKENVLERLQAYLGEEWLREAYKGMTFVMKIIIQDEDNVEKDEWCLDIEWERGMVFSEWWKDLKAATLALLQTHQPYSFMASRRCVCN